MKYLSAVSFLLAVSLFGACAGNEPLPGKEDGLFPVEFSMTGIETGVLSRSAAPAAPAPVGSSDALPPNTTVRVLAFSRQDPSVSDLSKDKYRGEALYTVGADGSLTSTSPLLLSPGDYDFYAYTPGGLPADKDGSLNASHIPYSISVGHGMDYATDFRTARVKAAADTVPLTLVRHCSQLNFALVPNANANYTQAEIVYAELVNLTDAPAIGQIHRPLPVAAKNRSATVRIPGTEFTPTNPENKSFKASTVVLPRISDGNKDLVFNMQAKFNGNKTETTTFSAPVPDIAFEAGYQYTFTIKIRWMTATLELEIVPWTDQALDAGDMGEGSRVTFVLGEWTDFIWDNMDMGTNGSASLEVSGWEPNKNLSVDIGG